jgi:hypothetical protein
LHGTTTFPPGDPVLGNTISIPAWNENDAAVLRKTVRKYFIGKLKKSSVKTIFPSATVDAHEEGSVVVEQITVDTCREEIHGLPQPAEKIGIYNDARAIDYVEEVVPPKFIAVACQSQNEIKWCVVKCHHYR